MQERVSTKAKVSWFGWKRSIKLTNSGKFDQEKGRGYLNNIYKECKRDITTGAADNKQVDNIIISSCQSIC